ncbi:MAG: hypothetical protein QHJ73_10220 [Armatimonadota bacterium]|jgi:hypothetical protein|nr:hypothetical protein [Armatimonadota bacterium]
MSVASFGGPFPLGNVGDIQARLLGGAWQVKHYDVISVRAWQVAREARGVFRLDLPPPWVVFLLFCCLREER